MLYPKKGFRKIMTQSVLTIITITRNDTTGLLRTLNSLLSQDNFNFHWLVVDGSDESFFDSNLSLLKSTLPFSHSYSYRPPNGIYDAMNYAIDQSETDWIFFLNSGDYFYGSKSLDFFKNVIVINSDEELVAFAVAIVTSTGYIIDVVLPKITVVQCEKHAIMNHQGVFIKLSLVRDLGKFNLEFKLSGDSELLDRALMQTIPKLVKVVCTSFVLGGESGKHYVNTVNELAKFRSKQPAGFKLGYLAFKTIVRLRFLNSDENSFTFFLASRFLIRRDKKYRKTIGLLMPPS
jgi:glycosyltransferase involved in cell wall biosynthesis